MIVPKLPTFHPFGATLTALVAMLGVFSWWIDPSGDVGQIWRLLLLWALMSIVYAGTCLGVLYKKWQITVRPVLFWAALMRLVLLFSQPILETDYYRYLWDGYVTLQGVNPYRYSPAQVLRSLEEAQPNSDAQLERLSAIVLQDEKAEEILRLVNHPEYNSIYPPFAQTLFAFSVWVLPHSLYGWRIVMLLFDAALIVVSVRLLSEWNLDESRVIFYAWSPLVLKEYVNTAHLDVVMLACLLAAMWRLNNGWRVTGGTLFAAAVLSKWFPLVLLPIWAKKMGGKGVAAFILGCALIAAPFYANLSTSWQGTTAFGMRWESNSSLVTVIERLLDTISFGEPELFIAGVNIDSFMAAKMICLLIAFGSMCRLAWISNKSRDNEPVEWRCSFLLTGMVLLCSPVVNPWYIAWIVPFLCFFPSRAWLYLSCACLGYYSVFMNRPYGYPFWLKIFEYGPFTVLAWLEWKRRK